MLSIFSEHNATKLEIDNKKNWKLHEHMDIQQLTPEQPTKGSRQKLRKFKKFPETNENGNVTTQNLWDAAKAD